MRVKEVIVPAISRYLKKAIDQANLEAVVNEVEVNGDTEKFNDFIDELERLHDSIISPNGFPAGNTYLLDLKNLLKQQSSIFLIEKYKLFDYEICKVSVNLAEIIASNYDIDEKLLLNPDDFIAIENTDKNISAIAYGYLNQSSKDLSLGFIDFSSDKWIELIKDEDTGFNNNFLCTFLKLIDELGDKFKSSGYILCSKPVVSQKSIESAVKLHIVLSGGEIHEPKISDSRPSVNVHVLIDPKNDYQQFDEAMVILSEYNNRKEILSKYLSLYHVIENFMFRLPIARLESRSDGKMLRIRDFKILNIAVRDSEERLLKKLIDSVWELSFSGASIGDIAHQQLKKLRDVDSVDEEEIDRFSEKLGMRKKDREIYTYDRLYASKDEYKSRFHGFIYKVRNSIVHNSETELHISNSELNETVLAILETMLIPVMEEISFGLLATKDSPVWYNNNSLELYPK